MFETSLVRGRSQTAVSRYRFLTLSLAFHGCAIAAIIMATLATVRLPTDSPRQMEFAPIFPAVTLPPALGTPDAPPKAKAAAPAPVAKAAPSTPAPVTAPQTIPEQPAAPATDVPSSTATDVSTGTGEPGSGAGRGVPGGDPNGIGTDATKIGLPVTGGGPLPVTGDVKAPIVIRRVLPEYPRVAVAGRINGWVIVECIIDKTGHIQNARVVQSSFKAFEQPALDAVQQWVFSPGTLHGQRVDTIFALTVTFTIK